MLFDPGRGPFGTVASRLGTLTAAVRRPRRLAARPADSLRLFADDGDGWHPGRLADGLWEVTHGAVDDVRQGSNFSTPAAPSSSRRRRACSSLSGVMSWPDASTTSSGSGNSSVPVWRTASGVCGPHSSSPVPSDIISPAFEYVRRASLRTMFGVRDQPLKWAAIFTDRRCSRAGSQPRHTPLPGPSRPLRPLHDPCAPPAVGLETRWPRKALLEHPVAPWSQHCSRCPPDFRPGKKPDPADSRRFSLQPMHLAKGLARRAGQ